MPHLLPPPYRRALHCARGFTLVEVALALGITSFCLVALVGLFSLGINAERESTERLDASHIAQSLIAARRASSNAASTENFPLPKFSSVNPGDSVSNSVLLDENGNLTASGKAARYKLTYRITAPPSGEIRPYTLYLNISWPANAPAGQQQGSVEQTSFLSSRS